MRIVYFKKSDTEKDESIGINVEFIEAIELFTPTSCRLRMNSGMYYCVKGTLAETREKVYS